MDLSQIVLFGNSSKASHVAGKRTEPKTKAPKQKKPLKVLAVILAIILVLEGCYFFCCYSNNSFISYWRNVYINTALSTMRHQWLATMLLPHDVVQQVIDRNTAVSQAAANKTSTWQTGSQPTRQLEAEVQTIVPEVRELTEEEKLALARENFYTLFWELDEASMEEYLAANPQTLANGWEHIKINEAGLDDQGTSIRTIFGEQVLAIDAANSILLVRVAGDKYRGVLAIGKNPKQFGMEWAVTVGKSGQVVGKIAERSNSILAMTGSGFIDEDAFGNQGNGNGGILAGYAKCHGVAAQGRLSKNVSWHNFVRMEIRNDDLMYITSINDPVSEDCRDALEFEPAIIVDGESLVTDWWIELNPRTAVGQSDKYEYLMLAIEGRNPAAGIIGTDINECAKILKQHNCMQAINLDGGASTMMWYDGEYIIRCGNLSLSQGRPLPNAIVYHAADAQ